MEKAFTAPMVWDGERLTGNPLTLQRRQDWLRELKKGQKVWDTLDTKLPSRSAEFNRLYWLYVGHISKETGDSKEGLHELFKKKFIIPKVEDVRGRPQEIYKSTTKMTKGEFNEYIKKIEAWTGILVPDMEVAVPNIDYPKNDKKILI